MGTGGKMNVVSSDAKLMFDVVWDNSPDQLPELGQLIQSNVSSIMATWEALIESHLPASRRTSHRSELRNHLPEFLEMAGRDLIVGREGLTATTKPSARVHGLQRWHQGWEL